MKISEYNFKIRDNLTICLNLINRRLLKKNWMATPKRFDAVVHMAKEIKKKRGVTMLEASIILKEDLKSKNNNK